MMRRRLAVLLLLSGCQSTPATGGELSHEECADLVRRAQRLQAEDPGVGRAMNVRLKSDIEGCIVRGTHRAYSCVQQAETVTDLDACEALMK